MLETPHVIVGAAIATKVVNPALALPLALGSHFILDKVPHWNPHLNKELDKHGYVTRKSFKFVTVDSLAALALGISIAFSASVDNFHALIILLACFFSVLPDVVVAPYYFLKAKNSYLKKWVYLKKSLQVDVPKIPGLITQFIIVAVALWWIL